MTTWTKESGWTSAANGTHLVGYIATTHADLVETFGTPTFADSGDKVTCEWVLVFADGTVATIYDYKEYATPYGMYQWHIGGHDSAATERVHQAMKKGV